MGRYNTSPLAGTGRMQCRSLPSSRGLGHSPLKAGTRVRIPLGAPIPRPHSGQWPFGTHPGRSRIDFEYHLMTMRLQVVATTTLFGLALSTGALACSICRCGDPTFNALGKEGISLPGLRLAPRLGRGPEIGGASATMSSHPCSNTARRFLAPGACRSDSAFSCASPRGARSRSRSKPGKRSGTGQRSLGSRRSPRRLGCGRRASTATSVSRFQHFCGRGVKTDWDCRE